jgi:PTS system fructose-specific IIA component/PTS system nitrogen regulatory IIA component
VSDSAERFGYPVVDLPASATACAEDAVRFLVQELVRSGRLQVEDAERVCCQVLRRESQGSTSLGRGVALPHSKSDAVGQVSGVVGRAAGPIPWPRGPDTESVWLVCLLLTPASSPGEALRALVDVSRRLRDG